MKKTTRLLAAAMLTVIPGHALSAGDYLLSTPGTSLLISGTEGEKAFFRYYGSRITEDDIPDIYASGLAFGNEAYPVFGLNTPGERAMAVTHGDGNMSLDLAVESISRYTAEDGEILEIVHRDRLYPFTVRQFFKAYRDTDIISTWTETEHQERKPVTLHRFASAFLPVMRGDNWLTHFHGHWGAESTMVEERLANGQKVISNTDGLVNTETDNPSFMLTMDGRPDENSGNVFGGALAWSGNYLIKFDARNTALTVSAGINETSSHYILGRDEKFSTPEFAMTYSREGKGGISRAFHRWARSYGLYGAGRLHDILLNSWEGVYFKVNQESMEKMMTGFSQLGGELFVMDDGWFGDKYPRNSGSSSLGDWTVCREKLPGGIEGLLKAARDRGLKFGIWIEPEMTNTKSELFERHPDWVLQAKGRPLSTGRGGTQIVLDLTNPEVQDFVFGVVDGLMTAWPEIAYMKWDANSWLLDYGSTYLPADRQSHIYIDYHRGLGKVLRRIREKYPDLVLQACAGGGGRINYGLLPYFDEFWTSDNTDALQRIYLQWGISHFYPAIAMGAHVSAGKNHQTGRTIPLKFRFDVAMSGRLGMEMQPDALDGAEKEFAARAIAAYKDIRPVVQKGDLYRLLSPYENRGAASLMYVTPEKDRAVFFAYKTSHFVNMTMPVIRFHGLDPDKEYILRDIDPETAGRPCPVDGKSISGKILMDTGLQMKDILKKEYSSVVIELIGTE